MWIEIREISLNTQSRQKRPQCHQMLSTPMIHGLQVCSKYPVVGHRILVSLQTIAVVRVAGRMLLCWAHKSVTTLIWISRLLSAFPLLILLMLALWHVLLNRHVSLWSSICQYHVCPLMFNRVNHQLLSTMNIRLVFAYFLTPNGAPLSLDAWHQIPCSPPHHCTSVLSKAPY